MKKVYYLSTCDTCRRIMSIVPGIDQFEKFDIKTNNITPTDLDAAAKHTGGYEQLFSKRARKFRSEGWNKKTLEEK